MAIKNVWLVILVKTNEFTPLSLSLSLNHLRFFKLQAFMLVFVDDRKVKCRDAAKLWSALVYKGWESHLWTKFSWLLAFGIEKWLLHLLHCYHQAVCLCFRLLVRNERKKLFLPQFLFFKLSPKKLLFCLHTHFLSLSLPFYPCLHISKVNTKDRMKNDFELTKSHY